MASLPGLIVGAVSSFLVFAQANAQPLPRDPRVSLPDMPVAAMESVGPDAYGRASALAEGGGSPLDIALAIVGPFDGATQHVVQMNEGGEAPSSARILVLRDGLLDDSVRGERWDIVLGRGGAGAWSIRDVKRSWRCWRGADTDRFSAQRCP
ncbi:hypothetical protein [Microvirga mediterraneensis]|uniref:Uncharacterized protein n=1 Tax=Microvirga mediterraneensis TaxID=2754695 RepID=A0A838BU60_9HYPH|nr:hypothetical protein [Microvirga mediterraneensis]MBA1158475.1 hypothetical protein [Microvirga mediterraneensis]